MAFAVGTSVVAQAQSTNRGPRTGVVEEVLRGDPSPRYRVRWEDGHESIITPANGTLQAAPRRGRAAAAEKPAAATTRKRAATAAAAKKK